MPDNVYILIASCGLLGILLLWRGFVNFLNSDLHKFRGFIQLILSALLLFISTIGLVSAFNLSTYHNLTEETVLANIEFEQLKHDRERFIATLTTTYDQIPRRYELRGDQWQIDARIIKWDANAAKLGLKPLYQFERLSGRYSDIEREKMAERSPNQLRIDKGFDVWAAAKKMENLLPFIDTSFGSSVYLPMAHRQKYQISLTQSGLIARPANPS